MSLYFLFEAAQQFAALDTVVAGHVLKALLDGKPPKEVAKKASVRGEGDIVRLVHTGVAHLWLGAFAEHEDLTIVSLGHNEPGSQFRQKIRALTRARKRPTLGGLSLSETPADIQESLRALLAEHRALFYYATHGIAETNVQGLFSTENRYDVRRHLGRQLARSARRWGTAQARRDFRGVLHDASTAPQLVERDGQEVLIIDRNLLERYEQPLSGAALAARFSNNKLSPLQFADEMVPEPDPEIQLGARN